MASKLLKTLQDPYNSVVDPDPDFQFISNPDPILKLGRQVIND